MSELYPSDADLLALVEDGTTGVEYIATGKAPYYLEFRRMLHRLLLHVSPLGLRVCKTGELAARVKPGRYWLAGQLNAFAGSPADIALNDNATNYVYIQSDNTAAASAVGWPVEEHIKLATIVTAGGDFDIEDIADLRGAMLSSLGSTLQATPEEINRAISGIGATVTAENLDSLTSGGNADELHVHDSDWLPFGDGRDGDLVVADGQTVNITSPKFYDNITVQAGGTLIIGVDGQYNWPQVRIADTLTVAGTLRAARAPYINHAGATKTTAGAGTNNTPVGYGKCPATLIGERCGRAGSPGRGGGDGANAGGSVFYDAAATLAAYGMHRFLGAMINEGSTAGGTGAGGNGSNALSLLDILLDPQTCRRIPGAMGFGGSSGALKQAGGSNAGGGGGEGGAGGGIVDIVAHAVLVNVGGIIHADGADGAGGQHGVATNAAGDISGGGGGGAGGGGGMVLIQYGPGGFTNSGTVRAAGGAGGAGGLGYEFNAVARPASNGGSGGSGSAGLVATVQIA